MPDGASGQDRDNYTDDQDRESYTVSTDNQVMDVIRIVLVPVGEEPRVEEVEPTLAALQALVRGYIEAVGTEPERGAMIICNEDGIALDLPLNRYLPHIGQWIRGDFFVTKVNGEGDHVPLSDRDIAFYLTMFRKEHAG